MRPLPANFLLGAVLVSLGVGVAEDEQFFSIVSFAHDIGVRLVEIIHEDSW